MPIDLRLVHVGGGRFQAASKLDFELCCKELDNGERVRAKVTHQRSVQQNEFFHALVEAAFENQRGGPQLPSWRHLKHWLLIKAGHCDVTRFDPGSMTPAVAAWLRKTFDTVDFTTDGHSIFMKVARSVSFKSATADEMRHVVDSVVSIICEEIVPGCTPEQIMDMAKQKAA